MGTFKCPPSNKNQNAGACIRWVLQWVRAWLVPCCSIPNETQQVQHPSYKKVGLPVANVHGGQSWILIDHERQNASTPMILATAAFHCLARPVKPIRPCPVTNSRIRPPFQQRQCDVKLFFFKSSDQGSWTLWSKN